MSITAMKQALEVLEDFVDDPRCQKQIDDASIALRQAIEQAEKQEPVDYLLAEITKLWGVIRDQQQQLTAQREWVGLTDEERSKIWGELPQTLNEERDACIFAETIEVYLKEKNT